MNVRSGAGPWGGEIGEYFALLPNPDLAEPTRIVWNWNADADDPERAKTPCLEALDGAGECLLWVTETGIWPSSEDWPRYYGMRGARGEKRSIAEAPGHLFEGPEDEELFEFLDVVLMFGWDAHLLGDRGGTLAGRVWISHDGWVEVRLP